MKCEVLLFAQLREVVGCDRLSIELRDDAKVADAMMALASGSLAISALRDQVAVAVNERYASLDHGLKDGDVIALIPPVSGG